MATARVEKQAAIQKLAEELNLPQEHVQSLQSIDQYFEKHRINELFNELMTNILQERPVDARQYLLDSLKSLQKQDFSKDDALNKNIYKFSEPFLKIEDFEAIFDSYEVLGVQTVPCKYLEHALKMVGIENAASILQERYTEIMAEETVNKVSFVFVLSEEHKRAGFTFNKQ